MHWQAMFKTWNKEERKNMDHLLFHGPNYQGRGCGQRYGTGGEPGYYKKSWNMNHVVSKQLVEMLVRCRLSESFG